MKILYFSDMHKEFPKQDALPDLPPDEDYDVVVAAGDIGYELQGVKWLERKFPNHPVLFVPGNHEYYTNDFGHVKHLFKMYDGPVKILDPGAIWIDGVVFIGATMWSDLKLKNYYDLSPARVEASIADFRWGFTAADMLKLHEQELDYVVEQLENKDIWNTDATVVITHFVPTQLCVHPKWLGSPLNPYFTNDHDHLMEDYGYDLHIFGHTHDRFDIIHPSGTRVVGNPHGYPGETPDFEWKIVEV